MTQTLGIVEVDLDSAHMQEKVISRRLGGKPLLAWVVRQVTDCQRLDRVVVLSPDTPAADVLSQLVPPDVPVVRSPGRDALERFTKTAERYDAAAAVRIGVHTPFVDPVLIDRLVRTADEHPSCDYISYCCGDGRPALFSPVGVIGEWCRRAALQRANRDAVDHAVRDDVTRYVCSHPEVFNIRLIPLPVEIDRQDVRLRIESEEDWEHAQQIFEALGPERLDWRKIAGLLEHNPAMRRRMAALNQLDAPLESRL
ncbi:MAG: NTP transferase domain-containing protein [Planctomycetia bacterium]|nr:NTP transferase domain-containing protein [Planctomycetia bacterium]